MDTIHDISRNGDRDRDRVDCPPYPQCSGIERMAPIRAALIREQSVGTKKPRRSDQSTARSTISGVLLTNTTFGWPFLIGDSLKVIYDLTLRMFQYVKPPGEQGRS